MNGAPRCSCATSSLTALPCSDAQAAAKPPKKTIAEIPKTKWSQTKSRLTITVQIPAPLRGEPYVAFGTDTVQVTATSARTEKSYELSLKLHKSIKKPAFSVDALGRVYLTMRKQKPKRRNVVRM